MRNAQKLEEFLGSKETLIERCNELRESITKVKGYIKKLQNKTSDTADRYLEKQYEELEGLRAELEFEQSKIDAIPKLMYDEGLYIKEQAPILITRFLQYLSENIEECFLESGLEFYIDSPRFKFDNKWYISGQMGIFQTNTGEMIACSEKFYLGKYWFRAKGFLIERIKGSAYIREPMKVLEKTSKVQKYRDYENRFRNSIIKELTRRFDFKDFSLTIDEDAIIIDLL